MHMPTLFPTTFRVSIEGSDHALGQRVATGELRPPASLAALYTRPLHQNPSHTRVVVSDPVGIAHH